ncbi:MAG: iron-sulfur cluster assembly scaffold protein [Ectothiorhodospiraceae bacterium]|jgi:NifU-like protein involved in Fe-S cluster formation
MNVDSLDPVGQMSPHAQALYRELPRSGAPDSRTGYAQGQGGSVRDGVVVCFWLYQRDGRIADARFEAFGCPATLAAAAWTAEYSVGRTPEELRELKGLDIADALALPASRTGVALVVEDALRAALNDAEQICH